MKPSKIIRALFERKVAAGMKSPKPLNGLQHSFQRYNDLLCNVEAAFTKFPGLAQTVPILLHEFADALDSVKIKGLLDQDDIFDYWQGSAPNWLTFKSLNEAKPALLEQFENLESSFPYIVEKILFVALRIPELAGEPDKASAHIMAAIDGNQRILDSVMTPVDDMLTAGRARLRRIQNNGRKPF